MSTRWGILAPGKIAHAFATALQALPDAILHSVVSRSADRARDFGAQFGFRQTHSDLANFLADPELDIVYIASPHNSHKELCLACINAGKAVICEKPIAVNEAEAREIIALARDKNILVVEAVWTRFLPIYGQIKTWLDNKEIGDVRLVQATFSIPRKFDPEHRLFNPDLAGGSILDLGIYPVTLSDWVFAESPISITAKGALGKSGIDEQMAAVLEYSDGRIAQIGSGLQVQSQLDAWIYGRRGRINIHAPFWGSEAATLYNETSAKDGVTVTTPHATNGYRYEAQEAQRCFAQGLVESPLMPHQTSLRVLHTLDELRSQLGLVYPFERD